MKFVSYTMIPCDTEALEQVLEIQDKSQRPAATRSIHPGFGSHNPAQQRLMSFKVH